MFRKIKTNQQNIEVKCKKKTLVVVINRFRGENYHQLIHEMELVLHNADNQCFTPNSYKNHPFKRLVHKVYLLCFQSNTEFILCRICAQTS